MNVLSLFDGMSCGRIALERAGIPVTNYFASEIKPHAIKVSVTNYPEIKQLGDISKLHVSKLNDGTTFLDAEIRGGLCDKIDLLIGGSPCQSFSNANQYVTDGTNGFDGKSKLFFEYVRVLNELKKQNPNLLFLLENVKMKPQWRDFISKELGVQPIELNSNQFGAQNRPRLFWTNIQVPVNLRSSELLVKDILVENPGDRYNLSEKAMAYMSRLRNGKPRWDFHKNPLNGKAACLTANMYKGVPYGVIRELNRRLTPIECERLQGVTDNYTSCVSDSNRYNLIGDGWDIHVITHIFKNIPH
jgi:site-specific DNA-cytosine methylase